MKRIRYEIANDIQKLIEDLVKTLELKHIDLNRIKCIRSFNSKSKCIARIYGLPKVFQIAYNIKPMYVIEVLSEKFDKLNYQNKLKVLIHELLHIPKSFSGGLLPHKNYVEEHIINSLLREYISRKTKQHF